MVAAVGWFVVFYPNISALPLPSTVVNAYQGLLPTYLYAFQFPVNTVAPDRRLRRCSAVTLRAPDASPIGVTCLVVAYSASVLAARARRVEGRRRATAVGRATRSPTASPATGGGA